MTDFPEDNMPGIDEGTRLGGAGDDATESSDGQPALDPDEVEESTPLPGGLIQ